MKWNGIVSAFSPICSINNILLTDRHFIWLSCQSGYPLIIDLSTTELMKYTINILASIHISSFAHSCFNVRFYLITDNVGRNFSNFVHIGDFFLLINWNLVIISIFMIDKFINNFIICVRYNLLMKSTYTIFDDAYITHFGIKCLPQLLSLFSIQNQLILYLYSSIFR
jgi:hypothetical protein